MRIGIKYIIRGVIFFLLILAPVYSIYSVLSVPDSGSAIIVIIPALLIGSLIIGFLFFFLADNPWRKAVQRTQLKSWSKAWDVAMAIAVISISSLLLFWIFM